MKRPAFQFYPADWRKDSALQSCSVAARGMWVELICIMHECEPYGILAINGRPMQLAQISRLVGENEKVVRGLLEELEAAAVFSRDENGAIYSRRMLKDERIRSVRANAGRLGGNPNLVKQKDNQTPKQTPKQTAKQSPTPSSSSSVYLNKVGSSTELTNGSGNETEPSPSRIGELCIGLRGIGINAAPDVFQSGDWQDLFARLDNAVILEVAKVTRREKPLQSLSANYLIPVLRDRIAAQQNPSGVHHGGNHPTRRERDAAILAEATNAVQAGGDVIEGSVRVVG